MIDFIVERIPLKEYYSSKYIQLSQDVLSYRISIETDRLHILNVEVNEIDDKIKNIDELILSNETFITEVNKYQEEISSLEQKREGFLQEIEKFNQIISRKVLILETQTNKYFQEVVNNNHVTLNADLICECVSNVFSDLYDLNLETRDLKFKLLEKENELYHFDVDFKNRKLQINKIVSELSSRIKDLTKEELILIKEKKLALIKEIKTYCQDLEDTFKLLDEKYLLEIMDKIDYLSVSSADTDVIMEAIDNILVDIKEKLENHQTKKELDDYRIKEIKKLQDELERAYVDTTNYELYKAYLDEISEKIDVCTKQMDLLLEHKDRINKLFSYDDRLQKLSVLYNKLLRERQETNEKLTDLNVQYNDFLNERSSVSLMMHREDALTDINNKLSELLEIKYQLDEKLKTLNSQIKEIEKSTSNLNFIKVFNDLLLIEESIPELNSKLNSLKDKKNILMKSLKEMNDYLDLKKSITEKINVLAHEENI